MVKKIKCKINGKDYEFPEGTTVIQAFQLIKKDIAHYCWHEGLSVAGVCRLCLVDIKGMNKLQIACNTQITEGMEISNISDKVKEAVRWGLEFHMINHPLDCPICDQAGECKLQDQYMKFGTYQPSMSENKVKKRKVVDLGSKIVLDTERCILCSRCVRFTDEVTKTKELGIFQRGDKSEIGIFKDKPLNNDYAVNTVDICPVGALTSKDFRFQQRVWYLKTKTSLCTGCSTGCSIYVDYNEEGPWRVRPKHNEKVNGHWMCDKGRGLYKNSRSENRIKKARKAKDNSWQILDIAQALKEVKNTISTDSLALVLTGQYTTEEYQALKDYFPKAQTYHWFNSADTKDDFDGLLLRGDKNPNTKGLLKVFPKIQDLKNYSPEKFKTTLLFGPENPEFFPDIKNVTELCLNSPQLIYLSSTFNPHLKAKEASWQLPLKNSFEKTGSFESHHGTQTLKPVQKLVLDACSVIDLIKMWQDPTWDLAVADKAEFKQNQFLSKKDVMW